MKINRAIFVNPVQLHRSDKSRHSEWNEAVIGVSVAWENGYLILSDDVGAFSRVPACNVVQDFLGVESEVKPAKKTASPKAAPAKKKPAKRSASKTKG